MRTESDASDHAGAGSDARMPGHVAELFARVGPAPSSVQTKIERPKIATKEGSRWA